MSQVISDPAEIRRFQAALRQFNALNAISRATRGISATWMPSLHRWRSI